MMPKISTALCKDEHVKPTKSQIKPKNDLFFTLPLKNGKGSSHTTISIPTDSKTFQFDIDTIIDIKKTTSRRSAFFLQSWLIACLLFILVVIFWAQSYSLHLKMLTLQAEMITMKQEISLITDDFHVQKLLLEEISQRYDESREDHRHFKSLVEREIQATTVPDNYDDFYDGPEIAEIALTMEDKIISTSDNVSVEALKKYASEIVLKEAETTTKFIDDAQPIVEGDYINEEAKFSENQNFPRRKRSNGRGNKASQKQAQSLRDPNIKNKTNKTRKANRMSAVHYKGAFPETVIRDGGSLIAPWFLDESATGPLGQSRFNLREGKGAVQITEAGLYYVYAQVYYLTNETINSFSINLRKNDTVHPLAYCTANTSFQSASSFTEVSCFTSVIRVFKAGDQISLQQRERYRRVLMKDGQTFLGLVRLEHMKATSKS